MAIQCNDTLTKADLHCKLQYVLCIHFNIDKIDFILKSINEKGTEQKPGFPN